MCHEKKTGDSGSFDGILVTLKTFFEAEKKKHIYASFTKTLVVCIFSDTVQIHSALLLARPTCCKVNYFMFINHFVDCNVKI